MKGIHRIIVQNTRIRYDFELVRNLTILRGDSATGKTTLVDLIREYSNSGTDSSVELVCDKACYVLEGATWRGQLSEMKDSIVFIDEGNSFIFTDEFSEAIQATDNYYVIVSREGLSNLPYSSTEIYGIRESGRYAGLKQRYNEFFRIYGIESPGDTVHPVAVITEDSNAGYEFFRTVCMENGISCISAGGKGNILQTAKQARAEEEVLLIADGAAFGPEMDRVMKFIQGHKNMRLYLPESFEWIVLSANPLKDSEIERILETPSEYIESQDYFSWERFFTKLLTEKTHGTYLQYSKNRINPSYLQKAVKEQILKIMGRIHFTK